MTVWAVNGSARRDGTTALLLRCALEELSKEGFGTELVQMSGMEIRG